MGSESHQSISENKFYFLKKLQYNELTETREDKMKTLTIPTEIVENWKAVATSKVEAGETRAQVTEFLLENIGPRLAKFVLQSI